MGGTVALTIRFDKDRAYRGSCHTNVLPLGLWAPPFYVDLDTSKRHADQWFTMILDNRKKDPDIEELWGGHNMLAPIQYGLVVIDYVTNTMISAQGYSSPHWMINWASESDNGKTPTRRDLVATGLDEAADKWTALDKAGLLVRPGPWPQEVRESAFIKMPFATVRFSDIDKADADLQQWCEENFGLTDLERAAWAEWHEYRQQ